MPKIVINFIILKEIFKYLSIFSIFTSVILDCFIGQILIFSFQTTFAI